MRIGTYSIVARDPETGKLGVAVQSHWFSVGGIVSWAEPGVGAVATQAVAEPAYGPRALGLIREGEGARTALRKLLDQDPAARHRQVAVVDAEGEVAVHTGGSCIPEAGDVTRDGFSCQANMMLRAGVPEAMAEAFASTPGDLGSRLLAALNAGEDAGGDVRGRQSAALLIVSAEGEPWRRSVDLRVEDHGQPIGELGRLHALHLAYELADRADGLAGQGEHDAAARLYERASELAPGNDELLFWAGLAAAQAGEMELALERVRNAIEANPGWAELLPRLPEEIAPSAPAVIAALPSERPGEGSP